MISFINRPLGFPLAILALILALGNAEITLGAETDKARAGQQIFQQICFACHGTGLNGAPLAGDDGAWAERRAKGLAALLQSALGGVGNMPPRGGCLDCSDLEIEAAVNYLVSQ